MKKIISAVAILLIFVIFVGGFVSAITDSNDSVDYRRKNREYTDLSDKNWNLLQKDDTISIPYNCIYVNGKECDKKKVIKLKKSDQLEFKVPINDFRNYKIAFKYNITDDYNIDALFDLKFDNKDFVVYLPKIWVDRDKPYRRDKYGNEIVSAQTGVHNFVNGFLCDYQSPGKDVLVFSGGIGEKVSVIGQHASIEIEDIFICQVNDNISYDVYKQKNREENTLENNTQIIIEAEEYSIKSSSSIHGSNLNNNKVYPYNTFKKLINVLSGSYWSEPGQKVMWEFNIEKSGWYDIGFRYTLGDEANKSSYRNIEIDGKVPFAEFENVAFKSTGSNYRFKNFFLADKSGRSIKVFLSKGLHTIALQNTIGELKNTYYELQSIMSDLNEIGLDLQRLTAGNIDQNRTWDLELYMPDAVSKIETIKKRIRKVYETLCNIEGDEASYANNLIFATEQIDKLLENVRTIPNNIDLLNVGDESAAKYVGTVLVKLISQPLTLDSIFVCSDNNVSTRKTSLFVSLKDSLEKFCYSYLPKKDMTDDNTENKSIKVWINRPMQYAQMLQEIINEDNLALKNIKVDLSVMKDKQKLVLSNASGSNPDVVLAATLETPFDFAIRGAAKDFTDYKDFFDFYSKDYSLENLVPTSYNDGVYGLVETIDCNLMYYRKDIMEKLQLKIPDTWNDVEHMMPVLLGNSYNFYIPLASSSGFKNYSVTSPFIYQNGGRFYNKDGLSTSINNKKTLAGFEAMTKLFNIYSLQKSVPNFYNSFRYGEIPIGISGLGTYMQLLVAAPELNGLWDIAVTPGTLQPDGSVKRYQPAASSACMIFKNTKKPDESWNFVKWWLSKDTQNTYSQNIERIYGTSYRYNTANLSAFAELNYPEKHKSVIFNQLIDQKETIQHPANYMVEREVSNIWNSVVVDGENLQETIDKSEITINREIKRKMNEFGFIDGQGNSIKDFETDTAEKLKKITEEKARTEK